jgi:hypothetical protein
MACGCQKGSSNLKYEVTKKDGTKVTVATLGEAQQIVRGHGGVFKAVTS